VHGHKGQAHAATRKSLRLFAQRAAGRQLWNAASKQPCAGLNVMILRAVLFRLRKKHAKAVLPRLHP
jgi:hypothetical protein